MCVHKHFRLRGERLALMDTIRVDLSKGSTACGVPIC